MQNSGISKSQLLPVLALGVSLALTTLAVARQSPTDDAKPATTQEKPKAAVPAAPDGDYVGKIGRASCRERV